MAWGVLVVEDRQCAQQHDGYVQRHRVRLAAVDGRQFAPCGQDRRTASCPGHGFRAQSTKARNEHHARPDQDDDDARGAGRGEPDGTAGARLSSQNHRPSMGDTAMRGLGADSGRGSVGFPERGATRCGFGARHRWARRCGRGRRLDVVSRDDPPEPTATRHEVAGTVTQTGPRVCVEERLDPGDEAVPGQWCGIAEGSAGDVSVGDAVAGTIIDVELDPGSGAAWSFSVVADDGRALRAFRP